jgi:hypothetical protein
VTAPTTFTEKMTSALEEVRKEFPIIKGIATEKESFKPYIEGLGISFTVAGAEKVLEKTSVKFYILDSAKRETVLEIAAKFDRTVPTQRVEFNGKDKNGTFLKTGAYIFALEAAREGGWRYSAEYPVGLSENLRTQKGVSLAQRSQRIEQLSGQRTITSIPGKPLVAIGEKPIRGTKKGTLYYVYYFPIGAIRDALDFPVKFLCSLPVAGHVMTPVFFGGAGYAIGQSVSSVNKSDYYDPLTGFDKAGYDSDKSVAQQEAIGMGLLAPVWGVAYAGLMSVTSWAGTDDGAVRGFNSYIDSNAYHGSYDPKYFFPNYRSLVFTSTSIDEEELARLQAAVEQKNAVIRSEIASTNQGINLFNQNKMEPFKRAAAEKFNRELHEYAQMTVKKR